MNNYIEFVCTREKVQRFPDFRYEFKSRSGKTPEQDVIAWVQKLAFRFLRWTGALSNSMTEKITYERFTLDTQNFIERIFRQMTELERRNVKPERLLIGGEDFQRLMGSPEIHNVLNFSAPIGWGREIYGLKVEVIPWMRGMVVLP